MLVHICVNITILEIKMIFYLISYESNMAAVGNVIGGGERCMTLVCFSDNNVKWQSGSIILHHKVGRSTMMHKATVKLFG